MSDKKRAHKGREVTQPVALPERTFEEAVAAVLNAPPTPEQQARKAAAKARRAERKRRKQAEVAAEQHDEGER